MRAITKTTILLAGAALMMGFAVADAMAAGRGGSAGCYYNCPNPPPSNSGGANSGGNGGTNTNHATSA